LNSKSFAKQVLLEEVRRMEAAHVPLHLLLAMVQGIETAGALLDDKPFKAKGQGRKRFQIALHRLFPKAYLEADRKLDLYSQLRSHMSHCMLPATSIILTENPSLHLDTVSGNVQICLKSFYIDYEAAILALTHQFDSGKLKEKNIAFQSLQGFDTDQS
jgi:hypothetical protein